MPIVADRPEEPTAIRTDLGAIFISLELSRSNWLITSLSPGNGEKMSKHVVRGSDFAGLLTRFSYLREKARSRTGRRFPSYRHPGGWARWVHRMFKNEGVESHVVYPASIATSRRRRRAKTDRIDGETLIRTLLAYKRGEPRVCSMVKAPNPDEEDRRRITRERKVLTNERIRHVNRIKGLLFAQGISGYEPLRRDRRDQLDALRTGDGRLLPEHLKAQIGRELDRLEPLLEQVKAVEAERNALLVEARDAATPASAAMLLDIKGIGPEFADVLWSEGLFRNFDNRRQVAAYAGLAPTPWQSGPVDREQGVSKSGNPRLRTALIQLALAMAAASATLGADPLVPRTSGAQWRPAAQDDNRGAGPKAPGRALEICDRRRRDRGRRNESCLTGLTDPPQSSRTRPDGIFGAPHLQTAVDCRRCCASSDINVVMFCNCHKHLKGSAA